MNLRDYQACAMRTDNGSDILTIALGLAGDSGANQRVTAAVLYLHRYAPDTHV